MKTYNFLSFSFYISSICFVNQLQALEPEKIFNGLLADGSGYKYQATIFGVKIDQDLLELVGSGALIHEKYLLSAAHLFVELTDSGTYVLKAMTFYARLGLPDVHSGSSETIYIEEFYLMNYDEKTGKDDLILIKLGSISTTDGKSWDPVLIAFNRWEELTTEEGAVSSAGIHNTEDDMDTKLRYATANIVDRSNCDNILGPGTSHICIKMRSDVSGRPRGLCKYDGGAPFAVLNNFVLVGIASKPKENCDDTERGTIYTDIRPFYMRLRLLMSNKKRRKVIRAASQIIQNNPQGSYKL